MGRRFAYSYRLAPTRHELRALTAMHDRYWHGQQLEGFVGGPYADGSGGFITFLAADVAGAERLVSNDPLAVFGLIESASLKVWEAAGPITLGEPIAGITVAAMLTRGT